MVARRVDLESSASTGVGHRTAGPDLGAILHCGSAHQSSIGVSPPTLESNCDASFQPIVPARRSTPQATVASQRNLSTTYCNGRANGTPWAGCRASFGPLPLQFMTSWASSCQLASPAFRFGPPYPESSAHPLPGQAPSGPPYDTPRYRCQYGWDAIQPHY